MATDPSHLIAAFLGSAGFGAVALEVVKARLAARATERERISAVEKERVTALAKAAEIPLAIAREEITGRHQAYNETLRQHGESERAAMPYFSARLDRAEKRLDDCEQQHRDCEAARLKDASAHSAQLLQIHKDSAEQIQNVTRESRMIVDHASAVDATYQQMLDQVHRTEKEFADYKKRHPSDPSQRAVTAPHLTVDTHKPLLPK